MGTALDALNAPSSLTQRRQAASNLPNFELPPPSNLQFASLSGHKVPPLAGVINAHPGTAAVSVGNLLTPPSNSASEGSTASSAIPTGTTPNGNVLPVLPYTPTFFNTGSTPNGYSTGYSPQPWQSSNPLFPPPPPPRHMFSPVSGTLMRHSTISPSVGEGSALPPPPYDLSGVHTYGSSMSLSSPPGGMNGPSHHHQQHHHHAMNNSLMMGGRPASQHSSMSAGDNVSKAGSTPGLFTSLPNVGTPQHSAYPYQTSSSMSQSPHVTTAPTARISPSLHQNAIPPPQMQHSFIRPPYPSYSLPAMPGPAMTNMNSPGAQMSMVGNVQAGMLPLGFNSGYAANPQAMYGQQRTTSPQQPSNNDRPFKCDQCPQSFNRNHDLKRHKRIHLAVKPFPCNHCDKSFSRKDALKRHILVKGCGNRGSTDASGKEDGVKSESGSDAVSESPMVPVAA